MQYQEKTWRQLAAMETLAKFDNTCISTSCNLQNKQTNKKWELETSQKSSTEKKKLDFKREWC